MKEDRATMGDEEQQQQASSVPASNQDVAEAATAASQEEEDNKEEGDTRNDQQELQQETAQGQVQSNDSDDKQAAAQTLLRGVEQKAQLSPDKAQESLARQASESNAKEAEWAARTGNAPVAAAGGLALISVSSHSRNLCSAPGASREKDVETAYPLHRIQRDTAAKKHAAATTTTATARMDTTTGASQETTGSFLADIEAGVQPMPSPSPPQESLPGAHATCAIPRFHAPAAAPAGININSTHSSYLRNDSSRTQLVEAFLVDEENQNQTTTAESTANYPSNGNHNPYNQAGFRASAASTADLSAAFCMSESSDVLPTTVADEQSACNSATHPAEIDLVVEAVEAKRVGVKDLIVHHKGFLLSLCAMILSVVLACVVVLTVVLTHLPHGSDDDKLPKEDFSNPVQGLGTNPPISMDLNGDPRNSTDSDLGDPVHIFGHTFYPLSTTEMNLAGSELTGPIASELGLFTQVTRLWLSANRLTGTIPLETLAKLTNLVDLGLAENLFTGSVPSEFGTLMTGLIHLDLEENQFSGTIPSTLAMLSQLKTLNLGENPITGTIPSEMGLMTQLTSLFFTGVEGTFPSELLLLTNLEELSFDATNESGTIPSELGLMSALVVLNLDDNSFSGTLPSELFTLTNLIEIDFEANKLTGTLPTELGLLTMLEKLDMVSRCIWVANRRIAVPDLTCSPVALFCQLCRKKIS
jgi:hypothetical protein